MKRTVGFEMRNLSNLIKREFEQLDFENKYHVTHLHGWVIEYLYEHENQDIFQRDFEEKFSIRRSTASRMLQLMEKNGLLQRLPVGEDARLKKIVLTEKAIEIHTCMLLFREKMEQRITKGLTEEEIDMFFKVVDKMKQNIQ